MSAPSISEGASPTGSCRHCGRRTYGGATSCKSRLCDGYAPIWAGDWRRLFFEAMKVAGDLVGDVKGYEGKAVMLAVTAPGADPTWDRETGEIVCDGLAWDEGHCAHLGEHRHSGKRGCIVDPVKSSAFNVTGDERWSRLHRRAATETRRKFGNDALILLARVKEMQSRQVMHWHPVLLAATPRQREAVRWYRDRLAELAPQYGWGYVSMKLRPQAASGAAAYLSSYFVQGRKEKAKLQESVKHPALKRGRIIWVNPQLTMRSGVTMRELRFRRFVWMRFAGFMIAGGEWIDVARTLAELERERGSNLTDAEIYDLVGEEGVRRWALALLAQQRLRFTVAMADAA